MTPKRPTSPSSLTHYTSLAGLAGITSTNCLWASNVSFLNDRRELVHGLQGAREAMRQISTSQSFEYWASSLDGVVSSLEGGQIPNTYALCLSEREDNLSAWLGYGGRQQGAAIVFNNHKLKPILEGEGAGLFRVIYSNASTRAKVEAHLTEELKNLAALEELLGPSEENEKHDSLFDRVSKLLPQFKHLSFSVEREWRYVVQKRELDNAISFRDANGVLVPYIKLNDNSEKRLPIRKVILGPGRDPELAAASVRLLMNAKGYKDVDVHLSSVPYRG